MTVLVTGASSLLASAVVDLLIGRGTEVAVLHRSATTRADVRSVAGDIADPNAVREALRSCDGVVHAAARVGVVGSWADFERTNVEGTRLVVDEARRAGVSRFVHVSTPSVAHGGDALVAADSEPADPAAATSHYSRSKAQAETAALAASDAAMPVVAIRPHLVWGPGDTQLIGRIIERARAGRLAFVGSGAALVDTTYVDNAASAIVAALDRAPDLGGQSFVVSNGQPRTIHEIVSRILRSAGIDSRERHVPTTVARYAGTAIEEAWGRLGRTDDPPMTRFLAEQLSTAHWFDQRRTRDLLHWIPEVSLDEGFARLEASFLRN